VIGGIVATLRFIDEAGIESTLKDAEALLQAVEAGVVRPETWVCLGDSRQWKSAGEAVAFAFSKSDEAEESLNDEVKAHPFQDWKVKANPILLTSAAGLVMVVIAIWGLGFWGEEPASRLGEPGQTASGIVFHDQNGNGVRDSGEPGIPGVGVSDQFSVTETDENGNWELPAWAEAVYFVIKPRGYMTPLTEDNIPRFFYLHKDTEQLSLDWPSVPRTGPLPASIDFPLVQQDEPDQFQVIFMGDSQTRDLEEVNFLAHDVLEEMAGTTAAFAITLGDNVHNDLGLYPALTQATGTVGIPFYYTHGNHDRNYDGLDNYQHFETWRTVFGPRYYSFDYGPVHFVILSNILFPERGADYKVGLGPQQLHWIEEDLSRVPLDRMVVLSMHSPLLSAERVPEFGRLYELLDDRPHTLSFSGHHHILSHQFLDEEDGWMGATPHHHVTAGATCGRFWGGARDETDIPHATSSDGTPNGYFVVTFDGDSYSTRFKAARRPADYQMQIHAPHEVTQERLAQTEVLVNIFSGSRRSSVEMAVGDGNWVEMEFAPQEDPLYAKVTGWMSDRSGTRSDHIWEGRLPSDLSPGGHLIRVRTVDMHGQEFSASRIIRVTTTFR
jgi:hypothetical protein